MSKSKYLVSEKQVKKALKIDSFRNLSKDKVIEFVSLIPRMDKEVAIAIINQFSTYADFAVSMIAQLNVMCNTVLASAESNQIATINFYKEHLDRLEKRLENENITPEIYQQIVEEEIDVCKLVAEMNSDYNHLVDKIHKRHITLGALALALGAVILGVSIKGREVPELDDDEDTEDSDETEDDEET